MLSFLLSGVEIVILIGFVLWLLWPETKYIKKQERTGKD